jgi:hypothetical protein
MTHHLFRKLFRSKSQRLAEFRDNMTSRFSGKRCLVLGSAPNAVAPDLSKIDACICVNGSPWTAAQFGIPLPELTVVTGHKTQVRDHAVAAATLKVWQGLKTRTLLFIEIGDSARHAKSVFAKSGFLYEEFIGIDARDRSAIIEAACGKEMAARGSRISNGIFAAAVVMWAGAREVVISGFSMQGGHSYMADATRRGHQEGDGKFFQWAKDHTGCHITTTSDELHQLYGLPRV